MAIPNLHPRAVFLLSLLFLLTPIVCIQHNILVQTHGTIAYPLDDAFINLTLAKNLAFEHVWGITKYAFTSVSTSLLYPFILAIIYLVTGASLFVPLLVNVAAAIWFLFVLQRWLIRQDVSPLSQLLIIVAVIYLTPLPLLVVSGMEYTLELLFTFLFVTSFMGSNKRMYLYGIMMLTSSYTTLPILIIAFVILLVRRQWWRAGELLFISVSPLYLFGLLSLKNHNYAVPNNLLLNGGFQALTTNPYYPGFLTGCVVAIGGAYFVKSRNAKLKYAVITLVALPLSILAIASFRHIVPSCVDVYTGEYQTAQFVYDYYNHGPVASSDLGAIAFWADESNIVDLAGTADPEVFRRRRIHNWTPASADSLSERVGAAPTGPVQSAKGGFTDLTINCKS